MRITSKTDLGDLEVLWSFEVDLAEHRARQNVWQNLKSIGRLESASRDTVIEFGGSGYPAEESVAWSAGPAGMNSRKACRLRVSNPIHNQVMDSGPVLRQFTEGTVFQQVELRREPDSLYYVIVIASEKLAFDMQLDPDDPDIKLPNELPGTLVGKLQVAGLPVYVCVCIDPSPAPPARADFM